VFLACMLTSGHCSGLFLVCLRWKDIIKDNNQLNLEVNGLICRFFLFSPPPPQKKTPKERKKKTSFLKVT
jgi:hypothetical protein